MGQQNLRVVDITAETDHTSYKGDTEEQLSTLRAISDYNKGLPKKRRIRDSLSDMATTNI